jgi:ribulose 1,5-bisphosphate carboxylase large subunit-like protein
MIADIETTGGWSGPGEPTRLFQQCHAQVGAIREVEPGKGEIDILFPTTNLNLDEAAFPGLWLTMIGGGTHALLAYEKSRLVDFKLPAHVLEHFPGPAFGPDGIREVMGAGADELLIGTIVKPTAGLTPGEVAEICYQTATGGVRFIKDDEKMLNPAYCPLAERVRTVSQRLKQAQDQTGQRVIYAAHITTTPERLLDNAHIALENGASALMINFFAAGFNALRTLRTHVDPHVPIYAHCGGKEAFGRAPGQGVDPVAVARFVRVLGGDIFRVSTVGGYLVGSDIKDVKALAGVMSEPMDGIRPLMPAVSGGLNPKTLGPNLEVFGVDALMLAGTGITQHPLGAQAGTTALRQAAEAFKRGVPVAQYAATHEELRRVL